MGSCGADRGWSDVTEKQMKLFFAFGQGKFPSVALDLCQHEYALCLESKVKRLLSAFCNTANDGNRGQDDGESTQWASINVRESAHESNGDKRDDERADAVGERGGEDNRLGLLVKLFGVFVEHVLVVFHGAAALYSLVGEVSIA